MKVENSQANRIAQKQAGNTNAVEHIQRSQDNQRAESLHGKDRASFSEEARLLAKTRGKLDASPDVRYEIVDQLKTKIESGNYEIPLDELAKRLASRFRVE